MTKSIYKSADYKDSFFKLYDEFVKLLPDGVQDGYVDTNFGLTHYLSMGLYISPVLIHFHGGNSINPHGLLAIARLSKKYRVISPDLIGHPGKSAETRIDPKSLDYGEWATEFIKQFSSEKVYCMGVSYGGGVLMHLAAVSPELINKAVFLVPTGFVKSGTFENLLLFGPALIRYAFKKSNKNLMGILKPLLFDTTLISSLEVEMFETIFNGLRLSTSMPRPVKKEELERFTSPCMIACAEKDVICPAGKVFEFASQRLSNFEKKILFKNKPHLVTSYKDSMELYIHAVGDFLADP